MHKPIQMNNIVLRKSSILSKHYRSGARHCSDRGSMDLAPWQFPNRIEEFQVFAVCAGPRKCVLFRR
jgi:hypothetical protein